MNTHCGRWAAVEEDKPRAKASRDQQEEAVCVQEVPKGRERRKCV